MPQQHCRFEASRSLTALEQDSTIIAVIELSQSKWLVAALVFSDSKKTALWPSGLQHEPLMGVAVPARQ